MLLEYHLSFLLGSVKVHQSDLRKVSLIFCLEINVAVVLWFWDTYMAAVNP